MVEIYKKELTLELMDKVFEALKKKHPSNFVLTVFGSEEQVTKVISDFDKAILDEINKFAPK